MLRGNRQVVFFSVVQVVRHEGKVYTDERNWLRLRLFLEPFKRVTLVCAVTEADVPTGWRCFPPSVEVVTGHAPYFQRGIALSGWTKAVIVGQTFKSVITHCRRVREAALVGMSNSGDPLFFAGLALSVLHRRSFFAVLFGSGRKAYALRDGLHRAPRLSNRLKSWVHGVAEWIIVQRAEEVYSAGPVLRAEIGRGTEFSTHCIADDTLYPRVDTCTSSPIRWVYHGSLNPAKGTDVLLEALALVRRKDPRHVALLIGPGQESFQGTVERLGLQTAVTFTGLVRWQEVFGHLRQGDLYVFPSLHEGLPKSPLEGMAQGLPVIATDTASYVRDGVNGLLVPKGDPEAIARAVERIVGDPVLRRRLIESALETARLNTYEHIRLELQAQIVERFPDLTDRAKHDWGSES